ncbi:MAG: DUF421 domain-containing protein [Clostridia bacterium]|nr:DUF421 domain-containing protein [Clostridia bacterium]
MAYVITRTFIIYIALIASMRLMGKRQVGELQVGELVVTLMLSELAVLPVTDRRIPVIHSVAAILLLLSVEVIVSFLETKVGFMKKLLGGSPALLIDRGRIRTDQLSAHRIEAEELLSELRLKGVFDAGEVKYAVLEENGKISVLTDGTFARAAVVDGKVQEAGGPEAEAALRARGIPPEDVFLMTGDGEGRYTAFLRRRDGLTDVVKWDAGRGEGQG